VRLLSRLLSSSATPSPARLFCGSPLTFSATPKVCERLIRGEVDLILFAQPTPAQRAAAEAAGVELKLTPIGREAFVFFVYTDNPVTGPSSTQIRGIYRKRIVKWFELGGLDEAILPFQRPAGSGSQTALELKVMEGAPLPALLREELREGMGCVLQCVAFLPKRPRGHRLLISRFRYRDETRP